MSWQRFQSRLFQLLRAALITAVLSPPMVFSARAETEDRPLTANRPILFAVDPVLGQAYVTAPGATGSADQSISVRSLATRQEIGTIPYSIPPSAMSVNPLTGLVYIANRAQDTVTVIHGPTLRVVSTARVSGGPQALLVEPTAGRLYVGLARQKAVQVLDIATMTTLGVASLDLEPRALGYDRIRNRLLVTMSPEEHAPPSLAIIDAERLTPVARITLPEGPDGLAVLDGLGRIYIPLAESGDLLMIDADRLVIARRLDGFESPIRDVVVNERRSRLYLAAGDADLIIALDPFTGSVLGSIEVGTATDALAVDPATARIYAASADTSAVDIVLDPVGPSRDIDALRITFQVTGGLAGLNDVLTIDPPGRAHLQRRGATASTLELEPNRFHEIVALFHESDFFNMRPRHTALRPIPDALTFSVTVRDEQREHTVIMSTSGSPPLPLVDIVRRLERLRQEMISTPAPATAAS